MQPPSFTASELMLNESFQNWVHQADEADMQYWENLMVAHPEKVPVIEEARQMVLLLSGGTRKTISDEKLAAAIQGLTARIQKPALTVPSQRRQVRFIPPAWQRMAAIWIGVLLAGAILLWGVNQYMNPIISYQTGQGETKSLQLPDGSTLVLNANSSVRFAKQWDSGEVREVWMEGEGYFDVKHFTAPSRKFVVHTNALEVQVLGTTFNVWQRNKQTRVVLETGNIQLNGKALAHTIQMLPGEMVEIEKDKPQIVRRPVDTRLYTSWKDGRLIFDGTPLSEVVLMMEEIYGVKVEVTDPSLLTQKLWGSMPTRDIGDFMAGISQSLDVYVAKTGNRVVIKSNIKRRIRG